MSWEETYKKAFSYAKWTGWKVQVYKNQDGLWDFGTTGSWID